MEKEKIARINFLANKSKTEPLTDEEKAEQAELRRQYIAEIRASFGAMLDNTVIQYPDGSRENVKDRSKKENYRPELSGRYYFNLLTFHSFTVIM